MLIRPGTPRAPGRSGAPSSAPPGRRRGYSLCSASCVAATSVILRPLPLARLAIPLWRAQQFLASDAAYKYFPWKKAAGYAAAAAGAVLMPLSRKRSRYQAKHGGKKLNFGGYGGSHGPSRRSVRPRMAKYRPGKRARATGTTYGGYTRPTGVRRAAPSVTARHGSRGMCQFDGAKAMEHVNYIGVSSIGPRITTSSIVGGNMMYHVAAAFLRKALRRHFRIEVTNHDELPFGDVFPSYTATGGVGTVAGGAWLPGAMQFYSQTRGLDGSITKALGYTLTFTSTMTFRAAAIAIVVNVFDSDLFGQQGSNNLSQRTTLYGYQFMSRDATEAAAGTFTQVFLNPTGVIPCWNWRMSAMCVSKIAIQNATVADNGSSDAHAIDRNPLNGKVYTFSDPTPLLSDNRGVRDTAVTNNASALQSDVNSDGLLFVDSVGGLGSVWNQPPSSTMFRNCQTIGSVHLNPGQILKKTLVFKFSGTIEKFMEGTKIYSQVSNVPRAINAPKAFGKSVLFALQKVMSTGADSINLNYQVEYHASALIGKGPTSCIDPIQTFGIAAGADHTFA